MDFYEDIRQFVLAELPHKPRDHAKLEAMHVRELLTLFFNWRDRSVPARPRTVYRSAVLSANPLAADPQYKPGLDRIITLIETGQELTPHLSSGINNVYQSKGPVQTSHLDLLLNDWGIHHLHLGTAIQKNGLVKRTGPLLFAVFGRDDVYLIDIMKHGKWADDAVIRTIVQEWPDAGIVNQLKGFTGLGAPVSEHQRMSLREAHLMGLVEIDGAVYAPAKMLTTAGTSSQHVEAADEVLRRVRVFEEHLKNSPDYITTTLTQYGVTPPPTPDLHFAFFSEETYGIVERHTDVGFSLT